MWRISYTVMPPHVHMFSMSLSDDEETNRAGRVHVSHSPQICISICFQNPASKIFPILLHRPHCVWCLIGGWWWRFIRKLRCWKVLRKSLSFLQISSVTFCSQQQSRVNRELILACSCRVDTNQSSQSTFGGFSQSRRRPLQRDRLVG